MLQINSSTDTSFKLEILGYEFPNITDNYWDSNWLSIQIDVTYSKGNWTAVDSSLTTFEVEELATWLEAVHSKTNKLSSWSFVEPCLEFQIRKQNRVKVLMIYFELEMLPKWVESKGIGFRSFGIEIPISEIDLLQVAKELRLELDKFPQRVFR
ncbi:hypothetical protein ANAEL_02530 [Anaerolineales bacterium]|nr:hypothetical protein ANAEL_02530 [Anaerolineales bacterium]